MTQPRWLEPLPDAELMRATDRWAIETKGVPARQLMERAGEGLDHRLLGTEARGEVHGRSRAALGVGAFFVSEQTFGEARPAGQRPFQPIDLEKVDADAAHPDGQSIRPVALSATCV